jgi:hypothetical protein
VPSTFFEPAGPDTYVATAATAGPWSPDAQHGGPPSALAARALEVHEADERQRLARVAIDILRPVPVGKISVKTRTVRPGRRVALIEAVLEADGQEVMLARGWRIERPPAGTVPEMSDGAIPAPIPSDGAGGLPPIFNGPRHGYLAAIEWRFLTADAPGAANESADPAASLFPAAGRDSGLAPVRATWSRPSIPLLPGEGLSAMSRALLVADSGSGVGAALPPAEFIFINVDLTVVLPRDPDGEWILLEPSTTIGPDGTGLTTTRLSDPSGAFGIGCQTLLVAPRSV